MMRFITIFVSLFTLYFVPRAEAQTTWMVNTQTLVVEGEPSPIVYTLARHGVGEKVTINSFFYVSRGWSEVLVGPSYQISSTPYVEVGVLAGVEQPAFSLRYAGVVIVAHGNLSFLGLYEDGKGGMGYSLDANYQVTSNLGLGLIAQRFNGIGPTVKVGPIAGLSLWGGPVWDPERDWGFGTLVGVSYRP